MTTGARVHVERGHAASAPAWTAPRRRSGPAVETTSSRHSFSAVAVTRTQTVSPEAERGVPADVETETGDSGATPAPATPVASTCGVTGSFTDVPPPSTIAATLTGSKLGATFSVIADFAPSQTPCTCSCGEYRQMVRGTFSANGTPVVHSLGGGRTLHPTTFQEDGDVAAGTVYGYRSVPGTQSKFTPDQATGCRFEGEDEPGIASSTSGTVLEMELDFTGELIDTCLGATLAGAAWSVAGSATIP